MAEKDPLVDLGLWGGKEFWSLEEAVALSLGQDPARVNEQTLGLDWLHLNDGPPVKDGITQFDLKFDSLLEREYALRLAQVVDATNARTLRSSNSSVTPSDFVFWADSRRLDIPRDLVQSVDLDYQSPQLSLPGPHMGADRCSIPAAAKYIAKALGKELITDDVIDLGINNQIPIACFLTGSGLPDDIRYMRFNDLEKFKSYAPEVSCLLTFGFVYLEDALVGENHFRYPLPLTDSSNGHRKIVTSISELFASREQLDRYISARLQEPHEVPAQGGVGPRSDQIEQRTVEEILATVTAPSPKAGYSWSTNAQEKFDSWQRQIYRLKLKHPKMRHQALSEMLAEIIPEKKTTIRGKTRAPKTEILAQLAQAAPDVTS